MADPALVDAILRTIRQTESGNNYRARNPHSTASGAYQFINSTWRGLGGSTRTAAEASPEEQDRIARAYVERLLDANGGDPRAVFKAWYVGDPNAREDYVPSPQAGNRLTVGGYADLQMERLAQNGGPASSGSSGSSAGGQMAADPAEKARELYGYLASFLDHPEVGPILLRAASEGWSEARLRGALGSTAWWQSTNEADRQWQALVGADPQEAEHRIQQREAELQDLSQRLGFSLPPDSLRVIATASLRHGWNQAQIQNALGAEAVKRPGGLAELRRSTLAGRLTQMRSEYAVPLSDQAMDQWVADVATGAKTEDEFRLYLAGVAKSMFPTVASLIDQGSTPQQIFDPYRQIAAQTLSINPGSIDLSDPKWLAALAADDGSGNRAPLRLDQWQQLLRSDERYGYQYTSAAVAEAETLAQSIAKAFGKVA